MLAPTFITSMSMCIFKYNLFNVYGVKNQLPFVLFRNPVCADKFEIKLDMCVNVSAHDENIINALMCFC